MFDPKFTELRRNGMLFKIFDIQAAKTRKRMFDPKFISNENTEADV
jgi:hypothetical protein